MSDAKSTSKPPQRGLSPREAARFLGHGRDFVMALIRSGDLPARDERFPGAASPRYLISLSDLLAWRANRFVAPQEQQGQTPSRVPRLEGVFDERIAAIQAKLRRESAQGQSV